MLAAPQKRLDHAKKSAADAFKTVSKTAIRNTAEATSDLIGIPNAVVSRTTAKLRAFQKSHNKIIQR